MNSAKFVMKGTGPGPFCIEIVADLNLHIVSLAFSCVCVAQGPLCSRRRVSCLSLLYEDTTMRFLELIDLMSSF